MSNARNLADLLDANGDVKSGALDNVSGLPEAIDVNASAPADSLNIDSSGDVGIGTNSPDKKLEIVTPSADTAAIKITDPTDATASYIGQFSDVTYISNNTTYSNGWSADDTALGISSINLESGAIILSTDSAGNSSPQPRMRIDSSGNVGIGTTNPTSTYGFSKTLEVQGVNNAEIEISQTSNNKVWSLGITGGMNYNQTSSGNGYQWDIGGTKRMQIDSSGRVTMPHQPVFSSQINFSSGNNGTLVGNGTPLVNVGSHFYPTNGRFTAPIAGRYFFAADLSFGNNTFQNYYSYFWFEKNSSNVGTYHLGNSESIGNNAYDNIAGSIILDLAANDYVTIYFNYHSSWDGDVPYGHFSGYLLS